MKPEKKTWISEEEATALLGCNARTLRAKATRLGIEFSNPIKVYRYVKEDIMKCLDKHSSKAA